MRIRSRVHDYDVRFCGNFATELVRDLLPGDVIVVDRLVSQLYADRFEGLFAAYRHLEVPAVEDQKSYSGVEPLIGRLIQMGFRKKNRLVAVGGGIVQDVTGFIASMLYRGVDWIFCPTTLLAQADSCIGGKTSINVAETKNQLGGFYPPVRVVIDLAFLDTLPSLERRSGLGEMAHFFLIAGEEDFERFASDAPRALSDREVLHGLVTRCLAIKRGFVERDEFDQHERQLLNYGHTFGHAIESATDYRVSHGIAVSYGMDLANHVSVRLGYLRSESRMRLRAALAPLWEGVPIGAIDQGRFEGALLKDKKNADGRLGLILTRGVGQMFKELVSLDATFSAWLREWFAELSGSSCS